jgi:hypothetical protein
MLLIGARTRRCEVIFSKKVKTRKIQKRRRSNLSAKENDKIKSLKPGTIKQRQKIYLHPEKYSKIYWIIPLEFKSGGNCPKVSEESISRAKVFWNHFSPKLKP